MTINELWGLIPTAVCLLTFYRQWRMDQTNNVDVTQNEKLIKMQTEIDNIKEKIKLNDRQTREAIKNLDAKLDHILKLLLTKSVQT